MAITRSGGGWVTPTLTPKKTQQYVSTPSTNLYNMYGERQQSTYQPQPKPNYYTSLIHGGGKPVMGKGGSPAPQVGNAGGGIPQIPNMGGGYGQLLQPQQPLSSPWATFLNGQGSLQSKPTPSGWWQGLQNSGYPSITDFWNEQGGVSLNMNPFWLLDQTQPKTLAAQAAEPEPAKTYYGGGYGGGWGGGSTGYSSSAYQTPRWFQDMMMWRI